MIKTLGAYVKENIYRNRNICWNYIDFDRSFSWKRFETRE